MAAITAVTGTYGRYFKLRQAAAQANTGQTDWFFTPPNAQYLTVFLNVTAVAGNTPILTPSFLAADPVAQDDSYVLNVGEHAALTGITAAAQYVYQIGPGITGIADDVTQSASADSFVSINAVLPALIGVKLVMDRTTGDEVYTYNLSAAFRG